MDTSINNKLKSISPAFQRMCNIAAISEVGDPAQSLKELVLHLFVIFDDEEFKSAEDISRALRTIFYIDAPLADVERAIDNLLEEGQINRHNGINFDIMPSALLRVKTKIDESVALGERVKVQWQTHIEETYPEISPDTAWSTLEEYLAGTYLEHGIQAMAFLDSSMTFSRDYSSSLSNILADVINKNFNVNSIVARKAINEFFSDAHHHTERTKYILECADGAFNFFSLATDPSIASKLRQRLSPLTLFCDTNFLFDILELNSNIQADISNELIKAIISNDLPIKIRYHDATYAELKATIEYYWHQMRPYKWSRTLSRAASGATYITGIELKYHEMNAEVGVDVEAFFRPFKHLDMLLNEKGFTIYRASSNKVIDTETVRSEYEAFLKKINKKKFPEAIDHDAKVLNFVRSIRDTSKSSLEAGALLLSCDYSLYRFDIESSKRLGINPSVVLPSVLWQILRRFISSNPEFDRSFIETYSIPEFRTIGGGAEKATTQVLRILASYQNVPEETAKRMLTNDLFIDGLSSTDNLQLREAVDAEIVEENRQLLEERDGLIQEIERINEEKEVVAQQKTDTTNASANQIDQMNKLVSELSDSKEQANEALNKINDDLEIFKEASEKAEAELNKMKMSKSAAIKQAEKKAEQSKIIASIAISLLVSGAFIIVVNFIWPVAFLVNHKQKYGLQPALCLIFSFAIMGIWMKSWRKALWGVDGGLLVVLLILQLLGGAD